MRKGWLLWLFLVTLGYVGLAVFCVYVVTWALSGG